MSKLQDISIERAYQTPPTLDHVAELAALLFSVVETPVGGTWTIGDFVVKIGLVSPDAPAMEDMQNGPPGSVEP